MSRTRFSEILLRRRKQLGLSIPQAAKVLRMRESVLEAFEDGDFERLPALGYAQGMISSYARYLGLDPRELTALYEREHADYVSDATGRPPTGLASLSDEPGYARRSSTTVSAPRPTSSATPLVGSGYDAGRRGRDGSWDHEDVGRRYTKRTPGDYGSAPRGGRPGRRPHGESPAADRYGHYSSDITTRRVDSGQYRDDLRFENDARAYRAASTRSGRQASRSLSQPERPNVRRRQAPGPDRDPRSRNRRREPQPTGMAGLVGAFFSDSRRAVVVIVALLAVMLGLIIVFSVRSCASGGQGNRQQVSVVTTSAATSTATTVSQADQQALSEAASRKAALSAMAAQQETKVKVSVAAGATTWVEIVNDGEQQEATTVSGPWEQEYTVTKSIEIQVADPSNVTVEKNGESQPWPASSAGVSKLTIKGTDPSAATTASATTAAATGPSKKSSSDDEG